MLAFWRTNYVILRMFVRNMRLGWTRAPEVAGGVPSQEPDRWATKGQQPPQNPNDPQRTRPAENRSRKSSNALKRPSDLDYGTEGQRFESSGAS